MTFWDTSALLAVALDDPRRSFAVRRLEADDRMAVWWGASVEYVSAVARRERDRSLAAEEVDEALHRIAVLERVWYEVQPSALIKRTAQRLLRVHPLRAADSLQLAAAIAAADGDPASLGFVCFDARLTAAASREGFVVLSTQPRSPWRAADRAGRKLPSAGCLDMNR